MGRSRVQAQRSYCPPRHGPSVSGARESSSPRVGGRIQLSEGWVESARVDQRAPDSWRRPVRTPSLSFHAAFLRGRFARPLISHDTANATSAIVSGQKIEESRSIWVARL